jgi:hypothetical protein
LKAVGQVGVVERDLHRPTRCGFGSLISHDILTAAQTRPFKNGLRIVQEQREKDRTRAIVAFPTNVRYNISTDARHKTTR